MFNPDYTITNGVYLGSFPVLKFTGTFTWVEDTARLEFTFDQVWLCVRMSTICFCFAGVSLENDGEY